MQVLSRVLVLPSSGNQSQEDYEKLLETTTKVKSTLNNEYLVKY